MGLNSVQIKCTTLTKSPTTRTGRFCISRLLVTLQVEGQIKLWIALILTKYFLISHNLTSPPHYLKYTQLLFEGYTTIRYKIYISLSSNSPLPLNHSVSFNTYSFIYFLSFSLTYFLLLASYFASLLLPMIKYIFHKDLHTSLFCPFVLTIWKI